MSAINFEVSVKHTKLRASSTQNKYLFSLLLFNAIIKFIIIIIVYDSSVQEDLNVVTRGFGIEECSQESKDYISIHKYKG